MITSQSSQDRAGALNRIFDFTEIEGNNLYRHAVTRQLLLPAINKMLKKATVLLFSKFWTRRISFSNI